LWKCLRTSITPMFLIQPRELIGNMNGKARLKCFVHIVTLNFMMCFLMACAITFQKLKCVMSGSCWKLIKVARRSYSAKILPLPYGMKSLISSKEALCIFSCSSFGTFSINFFKTCLNSSFPLWSSGTIKM